MLAWLTSLVCVLSQFPVSSHQVMDVTSPQSAYNIIQERENSSLNYPPREGETDQQPHFINHEHNSFHLLDSSSPHPCPRAAGAIPGSVRPLTEYFLCAKHRPEAEDIKMQKKEWKMLTVF